MFDQVVSLGGYCQTYEQIRRNNLPFVRSPFDRIVTPWAALLSILTEGGARLGLGCTVANEGTSPLCMAYGVLYQHEFERTPDNQVHFSVEQFERLRTKMVARMDGLNDAMSRGKRTLFVRLSGHCPAIATPYGRDEQDLTTQDMQDLIDVIGTAYPGSDYRVLFVGIRGLTNAVGPVPERASFVQVGRAPDHVWEGVDSDWIEAFSLPLVDADDAR